MSEQSDAELRIGGNVDALKAATDKGVAEVKNMASQVTGALKSIDGVIAGLQGKFIALTAVIAGGAAFKGAINASSAWAGESGKLGKALGITTQQASVMKVALNHLGIESDVVVAASMKLSRQIATNGQAFEELGINVRDASGNYRPAATIMTEVNTKLAEMTNPIQQNITGMKLYGKSWAEMKPLLRLTADAMKEAEIRAKELGLVMGDENVKQAKLYKEQMRDLGLVSESLKIQFGQALLPVFVKLGSYLAGPGAKYAQAFKIALETLGAVAQTVASGFMRLGEGLGAFGAMMNAILHGNFAEAKTIYEQNLADGEKWKTELGKIWATAYDEPKIKTKEAAKEIPKALEDALTAEYEVIKRILNSQVKAYDEATKELQAASKRRAEGLKADQQWMKQLAAETSKPTEDLQAIDIQEKLYKAKEALRNGDREAAMAETEAAKKMADEIRKNGNESTGVLQEMAKEIINTRDQIRAGDKAEAQKRVKDIEAVIAEMVAKAEALKNLKIGFDTESANKSLEQWRSQIQDELAKSPVKIPVQFAMPSKSDAIDDRVGKMTGETSGDGVEPETHASGGIMGGMSAPPGDDVLSWFKRGEGVLTTNSMAQYPGLVSAANSGNLGSYMMRRQDISGMGSSKSSGGMSPTVINFPGVGSFPMHAAPDVLSQLKNALQREALRKGGR